MNDSFFEMFDSSITIRHKSEKIMMEEGRITVKSSQKLDLRGGVAVGINGKIVKVN